MRIGLFGGSFNPIHSGHLGIAGKAVTDWRLDLLLLIPAKVNPFKVGASGTDLAGGLPDAVRWELVACACAANPKLEPWDIELRRADGPSYAIDTVRAAEARFPGATFFYVIGEDNIAGLPRWKDWETLKTRVRFVSALRGGAAGEKERAAMKQHVHFIVTAGPTREYLDPVRFLSNPSTGRMGFAVARAARRAGHDVTLIAGPVALKTPKGVTRVDVVSARDLLAAVQRVFASSPAGQPVCLVMTAAVADWRPADCAARKLKKGEMSGTLKLVRNPDILKTLNAALARPPFPAPLVRIGFAAETGAPTAEAARKCREKGLDLVVGNDVTAAGCGFGTTTNRVTFVHPDGSSEPLPLLSKDAVARRIVAFAEQEMGKEILHR